MTNARILVAARAGGELEALEEALRQQGYAVTAVPPPAAAVESAVRTANPDLAVVAVNLDGEGDGIDLGHRFKDRLGIPIVFVVDSWTEEMWARARAAGPAGYVSKLLRPTDLQAALDLALLRHHEAVRLRKEGDLYRLLFDRNVAGVYEKSLDGTILHCNPSFASIFGYADPGDLVGEHAEILYTSSADRRAFLDELSEHGSLTNYELPMRKEDGTPFWVLENVTLSHDPETDQPVVVGTMIDITDRKTVEARLARLANEDPLTGLANRRALEARAEQVLELATRGVEVVALLFLDLIRFKVINDTMGHRAGDQALVEVGRRLEDTLRASDTAARVGGDEFVMLLFDVKDERGARYAGQRILARFDTPFELEGQPVSVNVRIGIAMFPEHGRGLDDLMANAGRVVSDLKPRTESAIKLYRPADSAQAGCGPGPG